MRRILFGMRAPAASAIPALAGGALPKLLTPFDKQRPDQADGTIASALAEARKGGSPEGVAALDAALAGSQRTRCRFYTLPDTRPAYLDAGYFSGEGPRSYGQDAKENLAAVAQRLGKNRIVLLFPAPQYESKLDAMVLEQ